MVSLITDGRSTDENGRPFRRRRYLPWLVMAAIVCLLATVVWVRALTKDEDTSTAMNCNSPSQRSASTSAAAPAPLGKRVGQSRLHDAEPAPLAATKVRVLNANGNRGEASHIASTLGELGFGTVDPGNDPVYVDQNMQCYGQIRFGEKGRAAAASVQLAAPCAELIEDQRPDELIDLALGTYFRDLRPNNDAEEVLRALKNPPPGGQMAPLDIKLLEAARKAKC